MFRVDDQKATIQLLLDAGADINAIGENGTALCAASVRGNLELVRFLLYHRASMYEHSERGGTPMEEAEKEGHMDVVALLSNWRPWYDAFMHLINMPQEDLRRILDSRKSGVS